MRLLLILWALNFGLCADLDQELVPLRAKIDEVDDRIVKLLNERAELVREVGVIKKKYGAAVSAPARAERVLQRTSGQARTPLTPQAVQRIYQRIVEEMTAMEQRETGSQK